MMQPPVEVESLLGATSEQTPVPSLSPFCENEDGQCGFVATSVMTITIIQDGGDTDLAALAEARTVVPEKQNKTDSYSPSNPTGSYEDISNDDDEEEEAFVFPSLVQSDLLGPPCPASSAVQASGQETPENMSHRLTKEGTDHNGTSTRLTSRPTRRNPPPESTYTPN